MDAKYVSSNEFSRTIVAGYLKFRIANLSNKERTPSPGFKGDTIELLLHFSEKLYKDRNEILTSLTETISEHVKHDRCPMTTFDTVSTLILFNSQGTLRNNLTWGDIVNYLTITSYIAHVCLTLQKPLEASKILIKIKENAYQFLAPWVRTHGSWYFLHYAKSKQKTILAETPPLSGTPRTVYKKVSNLRLFALATIGASIIGVIRYMARK